MTSSGLPLFVACVHILVKASIVCREQLEMILLQHLSQSRHLIMSCFPTCFKTLRHEAKCILTITRDETVRKKAALGLGKVHIL